MENSNSLFEHFSFTVDKGQTPLRIDKYLMNFVEKGHDIFKRWYIDGRIYFHKVIDPSSPRLVIIELRYIDPRKIKKIREVQKRRDVKRKGIEVFK